jgi:hypothetical protein
MGEFFPRWSRIMSSDETKIEPTLIVKDAPIASEPAKAENDTKVEAKPATEAAAEAPKVEAPKIELPSETPTLPPAAQIDPVVVALKPPEPVGAPAAPAAPARSTRFALLAASVAIAASFGAVGGSLGVAKFAPTTVSAPAVAPVAKEHVAEEVRALKESLAQLRATTRSLSDNLAALKTTVTTTGTQNSKIAEALERIEKGQAEHRKTASASTTEVTGSIAQKPAVPMVLGDPPTTLKPPVVPGWTLRRVNEGAALLESREGIIEVEPGIVAPGLGRIEAIRRQDGRWVVVTARGLVVGR